ncbi:MAG: pentapeptide repeat-containing protein [Limnothrix sp. RL_2_0]|nr:pentapeptide repeat-containing protein [Limnothrix sp. RL_2_0]
MQHLSNRLSSLKRILAIACLSISILLGFAAVTSPAAWAVDYNKRTFIQEDFSHQDLTDNSYDLASLRGSDFSYSDLRGVRFFSANLEFVNFEGADLRGAVLDSARIGHTNFTNANLTGAYLASVKITPSTVIDGADFTDALILKNENEKLCELATGTNPTTGIDTADSLYCP